MFGGCQSRVCIDAPGRVRIGDGQRLPDQSSDAYGFCISALMTVSYCHSEAVGDQGRSFVQSPRLEIADREGARTTFELPLGSVVIGRTGSADIAIESQYVSRRHAQLAWDGAVLRLTDLGSSNGTTVNGERIVGTIDLEDGDRIQIGSVQGHVVIEDHRDSSPMVPHTPTAHPAQPTQSHPQQPGGARTVFVSYAREEYASAMRFVSHLRSRGWHVIIDQDVLQPGEVWNQKIAEQIASCSAVLVLISPASAGSAWVNQELVAAINARRPVLPVVIDSYDIGETRHRFGILGDRQWLTLDSPEQFDPVEMDAVAHHLDRLAAGVRPDRTVTRRERLGSILMWAGILGLVVTFGWYFFGIVRVGGSFLDVFTGLIEVDPSAGDPFTEVDQLFGDYAGGLVGLFIALPIAFLSMVAAVSGFVIRRNARKRRLMG